MHTRDDLTTCTHNWQAPEIHRLRVRFTSSASTEDREEKT